MWCGCVKRTAGLHRDAVVTWCLAASCVSLFFAQVFAQASAQVFAQVKCHVFGRRGVQLKWKRVSPATSNVNVDVCVRAHVFGKGHTSAARMRVLLTSGFHVHAGPCLLPEGVFMVGGARSFFGLASRMSPLGSNVPF